MVVVEVRQKARRRRRRRGGGAATDIKSNNPHLAGGEIKYGCTFISLQKAVEPAHKVAACFCAAQMVKVSDCIEE